MSTANPDLPYYLAFGRIKGIGAARIRRLKSHFGTLQQAWVAEAVDLAEAGLDARALGAIVEGRRAVHPETELERLARVGACAITWEDPDYPRLLAQVPDAPPVLFVRGTLSPQDEWAVAIVGTRRASLYGKQVADMLATELARASVVVVSGLARGIDAVAHEAALKAGGRTLAVLGCGVDVVYPPEHARLAQRIVEHGALISDYPPGTPPDAQNFPPRNRIISGLSLGVVVVEADERSGALITAQFAAEQGRDVFAVPGNIFNQSSRGTNQLIREGAKVVTNVQCILEELNLERAPEQLALSQAVPEDETERQLLAQLSHDPVEMDVLVRALGLPPDQVAARLALMELRGLVRQAGSAGYVLAREHREAYGET
ncbi:MAG: DNA-processing protein DprA [Thermoflexales bacterium]